MVLVLELGSLSAMEVVGVFFSLLSCLPHAGPACLPYAAPCAQRNAGFSLEVRSSHTKCVDSGRY